MSKNGFMKERTLDKLREESSTIYQGDPAHCIFECLIRHNVYHYAGSQFCFQQYRNGDAQ